MYVNDSFSTCNSMFLNGYLNKVIIGLNLAIWTLIGPLAQYLNAFKHSSIIDTNGTENIIDLEGNMHFVRMVEFNQNNHPFWAER